jgi:hypothetical protein
MEDFEARVNVTWKGQNADLPDPVNFDSKDDDVKQWVTEAVRNGIPGITADLGASFNDFVVDRFPPNEARPYNLIQLRPKTPFGAFDIYAIDAMVEELLRLRRRMSM